MLTVAVVVTLGFLPVYLWIRRPYATLPLHVDTGFYVSNHTVATGRFDFSKGWNARFAGCSKVVPELFYSLVYLIHGGRRQAETTTPRHHTGSPREPYKRMSRLYASLFNYVTAIAVGLLAAYLAGGDARYYYAGLVVYALVSSEPQYGVYYECAELFSVLAHVVSLGLAAIGVSRGDPLWIGLGAFVAACDACFVKLSSAIALVVVYAVVCLLQPSAWSWIIAGVGGAGTLHLAWITANGQAAAALVRSLFGHESSYGQHATLPVVWHRLGEKAKRLGRTFARQPIVPGLAVVAAVGAGPPHPLVWALLAGLLAAYIVQATDCWYYQIPLLLPIALLATPVVAHLGSSGSGGWLALACLALVWGLHNTVRAMHLRDAALSAWCWNGQLPDRTLRANHALESFAANAAPLVSGRSLLIYGPYNQAYVMLGASYPTPLVAPEYYLDDVAPGWQTALNTQLVAAPPVFVLDTADCFDAAAARTMLGLDYRVVHTACPSLRLLQLACVSPTTTGYEAARTFRAQSPAELSAERPGVSTGAAPPPSLDARETMHDARSGDGYAAALAALLRDLAAEGHRRLGVYGAGRFTIRHADVYRESRVPVVVVLDDRPARHGERFLDWPIGRLADARQYRVDAIVVSTDRFTRPMLQRARRACGTDITVRAIDTHRDPTCGNGVTATSARRHGDRPTEEPAAERPNNVPDTPVTSSSPDLVSQR